MRGRLIVASSLLIYCGLTITTNNIDIKDSKIGKQSVVFLERELPDLMPEENYTFTSSWERMEKITQQAEQIEKERKQKEYEEWVKTIETEKARRLEEEKRKEAEERRKQKEMALTRTMTVSASAYTYAEQDPYVSEKWGNKTFTGVDVHYGVVAVDPDVIPLHTKMKIEGFGDTVFTALDTGNAIIGNKIDIFLPSYSQAINFGRKNVKIYLLN